MGLIFLKILKNPKVVLVVKQEQDYFHQPLKHKTGLQKNEKKHVTS